MDWFENVREDDRPPEWMWPFPAEISEHFDEVRAAREAGEDGPAGTMRNEAM